MLKIVTLKAQLKNKIKNTRVFGWRLIEIRSLFNFSMRRLIAGQITQVAGSLTFTTVLALVPILTIALAIFTVFPLFTTFRSGLEAYFIQNLMPKAIASNILGYLNQFASKATSLSAYGAIALMVTSVSMLATIESAFNQIWRVKQQRPLIKRMMVYWALITLAPLLLGISLTVSSYLFAATSDVFGTVVSTVPVSKIWYSVASIIFTTGAFTLLYSVVPNRRVDWRDSAWGGLAAGIFFEIAKRIFASFIIQIPTYTVVYGALAVVPIFLIWIYTSWLITLLGAVIAASLPIVKYERWWFEPKPGSRFIDAMGLLEVLVDARNKTNEAGISSWEIRQKTRLGFDEMESLLVQMIKVGWVGRLHVEQIVTKKRYPLVGSEWWVLLVNPQMLLVAQVYRLFLFESQTDARLTEKVETAIEQGLQESLDSYFQSPGIAK